MKAEKTLRLRVGEAPPAVAWRDLGLVALGGVALLVLVMVADQVPLLRPLRVILGVAFVVVGPGYCLAAALFPRTNELDGFERLGLTLGLGMASISVLAVVVDWLPWGLRLWPVVLGELGLTALLATLALWRRYATASPAGEFQDPGGWRSLPRAERRLYLILAGILTLAALTASWIIVVPTADEYLTEFFVLGALDLGESYPYQASVDEELSVTVAIVNRERQTSTYQVQVWVSDVRDLSRRALVSELDPVVLEPGQQHREPLIWRMPAAGDDQQVEIMLFRDEQPETYRYLRLWVNVRP